MSSENCKTGFWFLGEANCFLGSYVLGVPDTIQTSHYTHSTHTHEPHPLQHLLEFQGPGDRGLATGGLILYL